MSALVRRLGESVKQERRGAVVTVAAAPDLHEARERRLQDWAGWLEAGFVDAVCPMAYTPEAAQFAEHIAAVRQIAGERAVWAGIGAYRLSPSQTVDNIKTARRLGATASSVRMTHEGPRQCSRLPRCVSRAFRYRLCNSDGPRYAVIRRICWPLPRSVPGSPASITLAIIS